MTTLDEQRLQLADSQTRIQTAPVVSNSFIQAASVSVRICQDCKGVFGPGKGLLDRPLLIDIDKLFGEK